MWIASGGRIQSRHPVANWNARSFRWILPNDSHWM